MLSLSFGIKTNKSSKDQVFQEVRKVLQRCWVSNFDGSQTMLFAFLNFVGSTLHKADAIPFADVPIKCPGYFHWYIELCKVAQNSFQHFPRHGF